MGFNFIIGLVFFTVVTIFAGKQVTPSITEMIKTTKVDTQVIQTEKAIFEAVCRYITLKGTNPSTLNDLITEGYFQSSSNNNGFGGTYSFSIDSTKGTVTITTDIADSSVRTAFINSYKNTFKPIQGSGNYVNTTFVIPTAIMHGNGQFMAGIPVQSTAPSASGYKYWYDTSGTQVVLKMSDGSSWKTVSGSSTSATSVPSSSIVSGTSSLPTTNTNVGDTKFVYDSASNSMQEYMYYNGGWVLSGGAGSTNKYIKLANGARQWSDSSYATSCLKYIQSDIAGYNYTGDTGDGVYKIDPDGTGGNAPFDVYCDQTTDGGGWTLAINSDYEDDSAKLTLFSYTKNSSTPSLNSSYFLGFNKLNLSTQTNVRYYCKNRFNNNEYKLFHKGINNFTTYFNLDTSYSGNIECASNNTYNTNYGTNSNCFWGDTIHRYYAAPNIGNVLAVFTVGTPSFSRHCGPTWDGDGAAGTMNHKVRVWIK